MGADATVYSSAMRRASFIVLAIAAVAGTAYLLVSGKVSDDAVQRAMAERVASLTGYLVALNGPTTVSMLPLPRFEMADVAVLRPGGNEPEHIASVESVGGSVRLLPLLLGRVEIGDVTLTRPRLALAHDLEGRPNWAIARRGAGGKEAGGPDANDPPFADAPIGSVRIIDGTLVYADERDGTRQEFTAVNGALVWPRPGASLDVTASLAWNGQNVRVSIYADTPLDLLRHGTSRARLKVDSAPVVASFDGKAHNTGEPQMEGALTLTAPSARELLRWLGSDPGDGPGLDALQVSASVNALRKSVSLSSLALTLDGNVAEGGLKISRDKGRIDVQGTLAFEALDLGRYLAPQDRAPGEADAMIAALSEEVDLSALDRISADVRVSAGTVALGKLRLDRSAGTITIRNGTLDFGLGEATAFGGTTQGSIMLKPTADGARARASLKIARTDVGPLLEALDLGAPLSGTANASANVAGEGRTVGDIVASLSGQARIAISDGALNGLDIVAILRILESGHVEGWPGGTAKTPFSKLSATFTIADGKAASDDFRVAGHGFDVRAEGEVRLISASVAAHGTAELEGATASAPDETTSVPFVMEGPIGRPILYPDPLWLLDRTATPEEIDKLRATLRHKRPEDVVEELLRRGFDRPPRPDSRQPGPTAPEQ